MTQSTEAALPVAGRRVPASVGFRLWPALFGLVPVVVLSAAQGGYFPSAWGWATIGMLWVSGVALAVRSNISLSGPERGFALIWGAVAAWIALSILWSRATPQTVLEVERMLVYLSAAWGVLAIGRTRSARYILGGVLAGISLIASFSLGTRLFPNQIQVYDRGAVYRLAQPLGYWNALAILAAMGVVLAVGFAARGRSLIVRAASAAVLAILLPTFYFTFGRAGWIALAAGLLVAVLLDPQRLQLLLTMLVVAPAAAAAIWLANDSPGLTHSGASAARAAHDGHRLAVWLLVIAFLVAAAVTVLGFAERRVSVSGLTRRIFAVALCIVVIGGLASVFARYGSPYALARKGYAAFKAPTPRVVNLNERLLSFSGNGRYQLWRLAWEDARHHPWLGSGAGSYERYFLRHQPADVGRVRDAHGLYVETLAELGPLGLILLLIGLGIPLAAGFRARGHPLVPAACGAYSAYLVHAIADWDWEVPAVTVTAIMCGGAVLLAERRYAGAARLTTPLRVAGLVTVVALAGVATVGLVGNSALSASKSALRGGEVGRALSQANRARSWMPWSPQPWSALGEAQLAAGRSGQAQASFKKAASMDPGDWQLWYDLARASSGHERTAAIRHAVALYPRSGLQRQSTH
jgi:O-Antigen ligase